MGLLLNLEQLQDKSNYTDIDKSIPNLPDKTNFAEMLDMIWEDISCSYLQKMGFDPSDKSFKEKLQTELLLHILNTLSAYSSSHIKGVRNFLDSSALYGSSKMTYADNKSFNTITEHLIFTQPEWSKDFFVSVDSSNRTISPLEPSDLIIKNTPLFEFIFSHLFYRDPFKFYKDNDKLFNAEKDIIAKFVEKEEMSKKISYLFNKEGRYFLSVLLFSASSKQIPYTTKTLSGTSLSSLNNFFETLYKAYTKIELPNNDLEKLLFFINTESIFQPSLLKNIMETCKDYFMQNLDDVLSSFISILSHLPLLVSCPLNVVKLELWKHFSKTYFKNDCNIANIIYPDSLLKFHLDQAHELLNYFSFALLQLYNCFDNTNARNNMAKLKMDIINYLSVPENQDITWSLLTTQNHNDIEVPSVFNSYFDFYIIYHFYASDVTSNWSQKDFEYSYMWNGYNLYAKYLLDHKK